MRGLAVLLVLMVHSTELSDISKFAAPIKNFVSSGIYGVQLFFIISGVTLLYTMHARQTSTITFYLRRFFRIAPAYYVAIVFYSYYSQTWGLGTLLNFTFLHGFSPKFINSIVPGGWSIGVEMIFYLLMPILFIYITDLNRAVLFLVLSMVIKTFSFYIMHVPYFSELQKDGSFIYFWLPNQLPTFAIGFVLYFCLFDENKLQKNNSAIFLVLISLFVFSIMSRMPIFNEHITIAGAFAFLIFFMAKSKLRIYVENRVFLFLGKISYSAYLVQYASIFLIKKWNIYNLINISFSRSVYTNFAVNFIILTVFTIGLAYIMFHLIEKPFQQIGRMIIQKAGKPSTG